MLPPSLPEILCREFSLSEIISATDNFSRDLIIGKGSFGNVYKGTIVLTPGNTTIVAVKRRSSDSKQGLDEFWTEVTLLSRCQHAHLISLIGYCVDQDANEMLLVYEYMPNGTLADHIYKKNDKSVLLSWEQRLKICIGVGRGLDYLHTRTRINQIIIHRDLKSSNILLDADWAPKISDFGLCKKCSGNLMPGIRIIPIIASLKGTRGYMDPHYCKTHELSTNTDVYAFGVVLLEVLCGRRSLDFEAAEREKRLVLWAKHCMREGVVHRLVDPGLWGSLTDVGLHVFLDITLKCLQDQPKKRPTLAEVVGKLEIALASQFATTYSSSSSVDSGIFKHFNQVAYSSTSASSNVDASSQLRQGQVKVIPTNRHVFPN
ncbi:receptor-like protein kinase FERONIA isoform X2 [Bidens hawaiensis]|uniref:receptor-like protein kinase FERONIA isoform X2 n=1 Tax=Bidens hawaiensis TaxID=980011 RepID=UPI00404A1DE7